MSTSLTLMLNLEALEHRRRGAALATDSQLARFIGVDPATVSRVISGRSAPGTKFIAGMVRAFGTEAFGDLFTIRDGSDGAPTGTGAVPADAGATTVDTGVDTGVEAGVDTGVEAGLDVRVTAGSAGIRPPGPPSPESFPRHRGNDPSPDPATPPPPATSSHTASIRRTEAADGTTWSD